MYDRENPHEKVAFEFEVNSAIDTYLNQDPRPTILFIADYFGMSELIEAHRGGGIVLNIPDLKKKLADRLWKESKENNTPPTLPLLPEYFKGVITPPDEGEIITGSGAGFDAPETIYRTTYLVQFLNEHDIAYEQPLGGRNTPDMMRGVHSYFLFFLPEFNIAINVNNQEGNATFIFYHVPSREDAKHIKSLSKEEYKDKTKNPYPYTSLAWTGDATTWQERLLEKITDPRSEENTLPPDMSISTRTYEKRTEETALQELEQAYTKWKALPEKGRGKFKPTWLQKNNYKNAYAWMNKNGGIDAFVAQASEDVQRDFKKQESTDRTPEATLQELEQAYAKWKALPEKGRGKFNARWLERNGFRGLYRWMNKNGGIDTFVAQASEDVQRDFKKQS